MEPSAIFNVQALRALTDGEVDIEAQLVVLFCQTVESCLERLEMLVAQDPQAQWPSVIHELKGAAANIHADALADLCQGVEHMCDDPVLRHDVLAKLQDAYGVLLPQLRALLPQG